MSGPHSPNALGAPCYLKPEDAVESVEYAGQKFWDGELPWPALEQGSHGIWGSGSVRFGVWN